MGIDKELKQTALYKAAKAAGGFSICVSDDVAPNTIVIVPTAEEPFELSANENEPFPIMIADIISALSPRDLARISVIVLNPGDYPAVTAELGTRQGNVIKVPIRGN